MNRELLQLSELILSANHFLETGDDLDCVNLNKIHSISFDFAPDLSSSEERMTVCGVPEWMHALKKKKVQKLYLFVQPSLEDMSLLSHANGVERWGIVAVYDTHSSMWLRHWQHSEDGEAWDVVYREYANPTGRMFETDNQKYYMRVSFLKEAMLENKQLATELGYQKWAEHFENGYQLLNGGQQLPYIELPMKAYLKDEEVGKIIDAITWAWVFGGDGWWTDQPAHTAMERECSERFDTLSYALYQNCLYSLMYCINI